MTSGTADGCGCRDYDLTRRSLLRGAGVAGAAGVTTSLVGDVLTASVFGAEPRGNVLVVLSQRGGVDGLSMVVPHAESAYYAARPSTAVPVGRLLHRDATFGLHPSLAPLSPLWRSGGFAAIHAVGLPAPNRSHFEAMEELEDADPGSRDRVGWLNRLIGALRQDELFEGVAVGSNVLPTSLIGPEDGLALSTPNSLATPYAGTALGTSVKRGLTEMYGTGGRPVQEAGRQALALARRGGRYTEAAQEGPRQGAVYPGSPLGASLRDAAALIRSGLGVRAIAVDSGGWDHHVNVTGLMTSGLADLSGSLSAFFADLGRESSRVTVVTVSEFGRRLDENGSGGVDHGYGNAVLVLGAGVRGGRYYARWPTLSPGRQVEGDLAVTTDYRHVLGEIVRARFPSVDSSSVFPSAGYRRTGFML
ncbi:DUF1501 domain-containing protein [Nocardioides sp.]|uniref:DUF1501 domain-containing protein n=1 Tax=Nocardioides sp. TaxID=35761 RepID=UPI00286AAD9E|nr:DUF1501 domain-containing protein [Nocardioides sp.]